MWVADDGYEQERGQEARCCGEETTKRTANHLTYRDHSIPPSPRNPSNALVQLQAHYNHCGVAASEKCLSAATFVRGQARAAQAQCRLRDRVVRTESEFDPEVISRFTETVARCLGAAVGCKDILACSIPLDVKGTVILQCVTLDHHLARGSNVDADSRTYGARLSRELEPGVIRYPVILDQRTIRCAVRDSPGAAVTELVVDDLVAGSRTAKHDR